MAKYSYNTGARTPRTQAPVPAASRLAVMYLRVSSKEQEAEGFSIPAQRRLLEDYAVRHGVRVVEVYEDVETAKRTGRKNFQAMIEYLRAHPEVRHILVEKTDRLYRNFKDYVVLDELKLDIHLVKENELLNEGSRSHQKLVHGFKVLMAKNFSDNLSEEVTKGMTEKAEGGDFPVKAPAGYLNDRNGKAIVLDPERAPLVRRAFELYASGDYSLADIRKMLIGEGYTQRNTGRPPARSNIEQMLKNPFYHGEFRWQGRLYKGNHQPLVSRDLFERVQLVIAGKKPGVFQDRQFAYGQMMTCAHCGCVITAEIKKERYVYYRCTNGKGKCPQAYVREEAVAAQFGEAMAAIKLDPRVVAWIQEELNAFGAEEEAYHTEQLARLRGEIDRLKRRLEQMYIDKLDGHIDESFWASQSAVCREQVARAERELAAHQVADDRYKELAARTLELAQSAHRLFVQQTPHEQRRLLKHVLSNCRMRGGKIEVEYRKPFELLAYAAKHIDPEKIESGSEDPDCQVKWA